MDALNMARQFIEEAVSHYEVSEEKDGDAYYRGLSRYKHELAVTYATVATAEAAERQAVALEKLVKLVEMIAPPLQGVYAPDQTGYRTEEEYNEAMEEYRYRRAQASAWAKAERGE